MSIYFTEDDYDDIQEMYYQLLLGLPETADRDDEPELILVYAPTHLCGGYLNGTISLNMGAVMTERDIVLTLLHEIYHWLHEDHSDDTEREAERFARSRIDAAMRLIRCEPHELLEVS